MSNLSNFFHSFRYKKPTPVTKTLSASSLKTSYNFSGDTDTLVITSNTSWTISSKPSWMTFSSMSGSNNSTITITVAANAGALRSGTVTITGIGVSTKNITVSQAAVVISKTLTASFAKTNYSSTGDADSLVIVTNTSWVITNVPTWMTLNVLSGSGNTTVGVIVSSNSESIRTAAITITGSGVASPVNLSISQLAPSTGKIYYIDNVGGSDSNNGLSITSAWSTLSKVASVTLQPGDTVALKKGCTWRETFTIRQSGNTSNRIIITNYGTGNNPIIRQSNVPTSWTNQGGNIWKSNASFSTNPNTIDGPESGNVWTINWDGSVNIGMYQSSLGAVTQENYWYYGSNSIYLYSTSNPSTRWGSVEVASRPRGLDLAHKQYIEINGIDFGFGNVGIYEGTSPSQDVKGLVVKNCNFAYFGLPGGNGAGIHAFYSDSLFESNTFHDCGRRGISLICSLSNMSWTISNVTIRNNTFYRGNHTTSMDMQTSDGYIGKVDGVYFTGNTIYEDPNYTPLNNPSPMSLYVSEQSSTSGSSINNIYVTNNIFKYTAGPGIHIDSVNSMFVYNNTFYAHNEVQSIETDHIYIEKSNVTIKNNIFYSQLSYDSNQRGLALFVDGSASNVVMDYNCFYRTSSSLHIYKSDNPYYYFTMGGSASMKSSLGGNTHSIWADPLITSTTDMHLKVGSPCLNTGVNLGYGTNIGAY